MIGRRRGSPAYGRHRPPADTYAAEVALRLEAAYAGWVVIWSPWRRMFTAFGSCANERLIIDEPSVERLRALMDQAEAPRAFRRSDPARWPAIRVETGIHSLRERDKRRPVEVVRGGDQA